MNVKDGRKSAALTRRVRADEARRSTRRKVLVAAAAWPALAWTRRVPAESKQPIVIGWLSWESRETGERQRAVSKAELAALGWKEGSQIVIEERFADGRTDRLPSLAAELAAKKPAVIIAAPSVAARAAAKAAPQTPIVVIGADPVSMGLAASYARPGGMVTGISTMVTEISEKYLELLLAAAPKLRRVGFLLDVTGLGITMHKENMRRSVAQHAVEAHYAEVARPEDIEPALSRFAKEGVQALVVGPSRGLNASRQRIVKFALAQRWPVIAGSAWAAEGALLGYSADGLALFRRAAYYVDRILKGRKPGDLPIEQPMKFELVINMKTARALKLEIPRELAMRADRVIE